MAIRYFSYIERVMGGYPDGPIELACIAKFDIKYLSPIDRENLLSWEKSPKEESIHLLDPVIITKAFFAIEDVGDVVQNLRQLKGVNYPVYTENVYKTLKEAIAVMIKEKLAVFRGIF